MLPALNSDGNLPPGVHHVADWQEFSQVYGTTPHRRHLLTGLTAALKVLKAAGCATVYIDGSFVTSKSTPSDFDACWETRNVDPSLLDPVFLTFDRGRATQKAKYGGEFFPASAAANRGGDTYLNFFQQDKSTGQSKGIVAVNLQTVTL